VRTEAEIPSLVSDRISASVSGKLILILPYFADLYKELARLICLPSLGDGKSVTDKSFGHEKFFHHHLNF